MRNVVVLGEGIVGASVAYHLTREGVRVTTVDTTRDGQATAAGAGIVSPGGTTSVLPDFNRLMAAAFSHYQWLIPQLAEDGQSETGFETVGELLVALNNDEQSQLGEQLSVAEQRRAEGVGGIGELSLVDDAAAREMFPALSTIHGALYIADAARLDGRLLRNALLGAAEAHGLERKSGTGTLLLENGKVHGVQVGGERIDADAVVLATGAWSAEPLAELGIDIPIVPQRGQIAHLSMPEQVTRHWPIIATFQRHYVLTFPENRVVAGATRETGSGFDYRLTAGGVHEVLGAAFSVADGLRAATLSEVRIGFRPMSPDNLPILGAIPGHDRLFIATGHGPAGLSLGAHSGAMVADMVLGNEVDLDVSAYLPGRFMTA
ncbi:MAG: FAD-binding oxidoreductase [Sphaerobacteraceae bacterium]|nr:MAG: FAD-binding oxidoreductase [Sphaerobacteraceae bacterium]